MLCSSTSERSENLESILLTLHIPSKSCGALGDPHADSAANSVTSQKYSTCVSLKTLRISYLVGLIHSTDSLQAVSSHRQKAVRIGTLSCTFDTKHESHCLGAYDFVAWQAFEPNWLLFCCPSTNPAVLPFLINVPFELVGCCGVTQTLQHSWDIVLGAWRPPDSSWRIRLLWPWVCRCICLLSEGTPSAAFCAGLCRNSWCWKVAIMF